MIKQCLICGKEFEAKNNQKYCSEECRKQKRRQYYKKNAEHYKAYSKQYYRENRDKRLKGRKKLIKECTICGTKFTTVYPFQKYCSKACKRKAKAEQKRKYYWANRTQKRWHGNRYLYPCKDYLHYDSYKIPVEICLNCTVESCRFEDG